MNNYLNRFLVSAVFMAAVCCGLFPCHAFSAQANYSIWPAGTVPGAVDGGSDSPVELGLKFRSDTSGYITGIRFYKAGTNTGTHVANLWTSSGTRLATATFKSETTSGWQQVSFPTQVAITANTVYVASYHTNVGHYSCDQNFFTGKGVDAPPLHALASGVSGVNGVYTYGSTSKLPSLSWLNSNYWVDVVLSATVTSDTTAPTVTAFSLPAAATTLAVPITNFTASDNVAVTGYLVTESATPPAASDGGWSATAPSTYTFAAAGSKTLYAWAKDAAGNVGSSVSASVTVTIDTVAPTVSITYPPGNSTVSGTLTVTATAADSVGVSRVEFYLDGSTLLATATTAPYSAGWDTSTASNGTHALTARGYDAAGNVGTSSSSTVTVANQVVGILLKQKAANTTTSAQNLSATLPSAVTAGNLIVVSMSGWPNLPAATAVTDTLGNTYASAGTVLTSLGAYSAIYYAGNVKGGTGTVTVKTVKSGGQISMAVAEFSGVDSASPLDKTAGAVGSGTSPSSGAMTPARGGELVIGSGTHNGSTVTTAGTGFTMIAIPTEDSNTHQPLAMEYMVLSGISQTSPGFSLARGYSWTQNGVLFKPAAGSVDTTAPVIAITTPQNNATVSGVVAVSAAASDNVGVTKVDFYLDGVLQTSDTTAPYGWSWDSTLAASGSHSLSAIAYDAAGNAGQSALVTVTLQLAGPESAGWYTGDIHVHRSCGGFPETVENMYLKMLPNKLSVITLLADMGNGEVKDSVTDLPLVTGNDAAISTSGQILHWDAEWHWDPTYTQYPHQVIGGHVLALGVAEAHQRLDEYTYPVFDWAHQQGGIAGFAHMEFLDGGLPQTLTCCSPFEYPVEVALGGADFISEDVSDTGFTGWSGLYPENAIQAYYKLLNCGFRPGLAAGTDYPCNSGRDLGSLLTYVQVDGGQLSYRNWIDGIAAGRTVVSRNGHNEFLDLKVNGSATPGDEIKLTGGGSVPVTVQWTANQNLTGTMELVKNGVVVASKATTAAVGNPASLTATVGFTKSGWLAARRMGSNGHQLHTAAVYVTVDNLPVRASVEDAQFFVQWIDTLIAKTSPGGPWNPFFLNSLAAAQTRYLAARTLYQQILLEAGATP